MENLHYSVNGKPLMGVTCQEYKELYNQHKIDVNCAYVLLDKDNYVIAEDKVIGQTRSAHSRFKQLHNMDLTWEKLTDYRRVSVVVSERPVVEKLAKEGERKLEVVIQATPKAEAKPEVLEEVVKKSEATVARVKRKRQPKVVLDDQSTLVQD